jgi:hypothetical protein
MHWINDITSAIHLDHFTSPQARHLPRIKFDEITCDFFLRLSTISTGPFFYSSLDALPPGYQAIARHIEEFAAECLASPRSKFVFRMFFVGHGHVHAKTRKDLTPIFSATYGMAAIDCIRSATFIDRFLDYDFAKCPMNNACRRCRKFQSGNTAASVFLVALVDESMY